jgi:uncharacterized protein
MRLILWVLAALTMLPSASAQEQPYPHVVRSSIYVPVRDGTRLAVNIYRPAVGGKAVETKLPVVFVFTPYRARFRDAEGKLVDTGYDVRRGIKGLPGAGYVVAVADIRGKGASFGHRRGFQDRTEAQDGYDLIEWLAKQPYATGKVGMMGCSYLGGTTFQTATTAPPSLRAVFVGASELDKYGFVRRGGITAQFNTRPDEPLSDDLMSLPMDEDADGTMLRLAVAQHAQNTPMAGLWYGMPYRDSVSAYTDNKFWDEVAVWRYLDAIKKAGIATYFWSNWQDEPTSQVILAADNLGGKFLAGPGGHCIPPPGFDFQGEIIRWFDYHLKGINNGIMQEPRATYHVMGEGWVRSNTLPGAGAKRVSWFLGGGKSGTARSVNDGLLLPSRVGSQADSFTVDYTLPPADYFAFWAQPMDDKGLSYTTAPLTKPMRLVGYPVVHFTVSADKPDANVFAYLDQVGPDGKAEVIAFGRLALSHRKTGKAPFQTLGLPWHSGNAGDVASLPVGRRAALNFDLTPVSRVIPAGSRLRVVVTGADPRQRNLADIKQTPAPNITLHLGGAQGSRIELPVEEK